MDVVANVRDQMCNRCLSQRCRKKGCFLSLKNCPTPFVLIDMDHSQAPATDQRTSVPGQKMNCDYIFVGGCQEVLVAPMEMKKGRPNASEMVPQLQSGANVVDRLVPNESPVEFLPIGVISGNFKGIEIKRFKKEKIRFRRERYGVRILRSGSPISKATSS